MTTAALRRVVGIADTDSYVKWAAALLGTLPDEAGELIVLDTPLVVSDAQLETALAGSGLDRSRVRRAAFDELAELVADADAVLVAARGPLVRVVAREVAQLEPRPVIVTGLPGISVPATWLALHFRRQCDLFVLHAHREVREFARLAEERGIAQRFGLARLPFAAGGTPSGQPARGGTDLVFAAQAIVPRAREDRELVARILVDAAKLDPSRRVVVKLRGCAGEQQTHAERDAYPDLIAELGDVPPNLVFSTEPMGEALDRAEGLVTVSSTAAIEAIARGVPVIVLDTFGVSRRLINVVFEGSGLFGGEDDVIARSFRMPRAEWLRDSYFHDTADDDWSEQLAGLVAQRRAGALAPRPPYRRWGGRARDAWERRLALGDADRTVSGAVAYAIGVPIRSVLRFTRRMRRRLGAAVSAAGARGVLDA
ncbi:DUF6716 putative glycosyltransferase [Microbacterium barkeri]|uniref:DUF6716 putative glycosyltransferase n=1 Tax=Microbacterium barkeri TaxID=33917 RepID=UPI0022F27839|nr:DUF6716 putative glycosyltransferase [Microbacterium barkeri]MDR6875627.1 hypothetical protein [Microbacterium barkeri]